MARFILKTQSDNNAMLLHSTMKSEFATDDLSEAMGAFHKEIEALEAAYINEHRLRYIPTDYESSNAAYCEVMSLSFDQFGEITDTETIIISDRYYER